MTDNEIIKAYELCHSDVLCDETNCPFFAKCKTEDLSRYIIDLINRQKAEIEMMQLKIEGVQEANATLREYIRKAVKEFAERLNKEAENVCIDQDGDFVETDDKIYNTVAGWCKATSDNLLKETVGEGL